MGPRSAVAVAAAARGSLEAGGENRCGWWRRWRLLGPPRGEPPPAFPLPPDPARRPPDHSRPRAPNRRLLTPALGGAPQELSGGRVVDEELPLGQALVEGLLVFLRHGVCANGERSGGRGGGGGKESGGASRLKRRSPETAAEGGTAEEPSSLPCALKPTAPRRAGLPLGPRDPDVSGRLSQSPRRLARAAAAATASRPRPGAAPGGEDAPPTAPPIPARPALRFPARGTLRPPFTRVRGSKNYTHQL